eukprot:2472042-Amphidinium_carterae.1
MMCSAMKTSSRSTSYPLEEFLEVDPLTHLSHPGNKWVLANSNHSYRFNIGVLAIKIPGTPIALDLRQFPNRFKGPETPETVNP